MTNQNYPIFLLNFFFLIYETNVIQSVFLYIYMYNHSSDFFFAGAKADRSSYCRHYVWHKDDLYYNVSTLGFLHLNSEWSMIQTLGL